jgi:hypothetical protein
MALSYSYETRATINNNEHQTTTNNNDDDNTKLYSIAMELDLSQWTLASTSSRPSSSNESVQSTTIMLEQESLTQNCIDGAEILNGFRSFGGNTGSHLPLDIVDVPPPTELPRQQPATITPFWTTTNTTIDSSDSTNQNGATSDLDDTIEQQLKNLAKGIRNHGTVTANFDEDELALRQDAQVGSKKYRKSNKGLVDNFFSIVFEHTESHVIKKLCLKGECKDGIDINYNFYHQMKGERAVWKQVIIDQMFTIYFLRLKNKKDPNRPLDFNTFKQYAKQIFTQMKMKGIDYDMTKDFNGQGQFHSVVAAWNGPNIKQQTRTLLPRSTLPK